MPADDVHPHALGDGLEAMRLLVGMDDCREQQGVEHRLVELEARRGFLQLQESHVERGVVCHQHRIGREGVEGREHFTDLWLANQHLRGDTVDLRRFRGETPAGIDELLERLAAAQLAIDDARCADLYDLVAFGGVETCGFGIEDRKRQLGKQTVVERMPLFGNREQIEVVVFGSALAAQIGLGFVLHLLLGRRRWQQDSEERPVLRLLALEPDFAVVALDDVAHRQGTALVANAHRLEFPAHHGLGAHRLARPDQVQMGHPPGPGEAQPHLANPELFCEAAAQIGDRREHREAVDPDPQGLVDVFKFHRHVGTALELLPDCGDEVGGEHFLERPAGLHGIGKRRRGLVDALAHRIDFVLDHLPEAKPQGGLEIVVVEHFGGGPDVGKCGPVAFGNTVQQLIAPGLALEGAGDVVQHENEAGEGTFALLPGIEHRRHLHPEQLPGPGGGNEIRHRLGRTLAQAVLQALERMDDEIALEHRVDGSPKADELAAARHLGRIRHCLELQLCPVVVQQDATVEVAHHDALGQLGHQRRKPVLLFFDRLLGLLDPELDILAKRVALVGKRIDGARQGAKIGTADGFEPL